MSEPNPAPKSADTFAERFALLLENLDVAQRAYAGYETMGKALRHATQGVPPGERKKAFPILEFNATADGKNVEKVALDLNKLPVEQLQPMVVPIIVGNGRQLYDVLMASYQLLGGLIQETKAALNVPDSPPQEQTTDPTPSEPNAPVPPV